MPIREIEITLWRQADGRFLPTVAEIPKGAVVTCVRAHGVGLRLKLECQEDAPLESRTYKLACDGSAETDGVSRVAVIQQSGTPAHLYELQDAPAAPQKKRPADYYIDWSPDRSVWLLINRRRKVIGEYDTREKVVAQAERQIAFLGGSYRLRDREGTVHPDVVRESEADKIMGFNRNDGASPQPTQGE